MESNSEQLNRIEKVLDVILHYVKQICDNRNIYEGDYLLNQGEVSNIMNVTSRTLYEYRQAGLLTAIIIRRRIFYKASEVKALIKKLEQKQNTHHNFYGKRK